MKRAIHLTLLREGVDMPCVVNVLLTDDIGIRRYNLEHRGKDAATDVLSFPMQEFGCPGWSGIVDVDIDLVSGFVPLGDMVISVETIQRQADEFGHSILQELIHMVIHSTLHLLGYDHYDDESEKEMRDIEAELSRERALKI
ncbi:MAG: rRNA maturation RNase YbeY [Oscillospiraceae bacterium]|nr:rRNA maturation RNase YbeY [Oscillospiraceae bacterium]MCL2279376.1 rRNA maturation RNase YbeY [Oscillospiraceae bacterium]